MKRLKQLIQVLVILLIADGIYLYFKYQQYKDTSISGKHLDWSLSRLRAASLVEKYVKADLVLTVRQANTIIHPDNLKRVQSSVQQLPNATDTIMFLKTHKTGSSTIQNILLRYFILHNLTIALPAYRASFFWPNKFSSDLFVKKQPGRSKYHGLAHHTVYNKAEMKKIMKPNPSFITILREPVSLFRSAYIYYNMQGYCFNTTVEHIKSSPNYQAFRQGICPSTQTPVRNLQAFDLGLSLRDMEKGTAIRSLIQDIDETMRLVLITERFDESLILLKKMFKWSMEDIVYFKQNAQAPRPTSLGPTARGESADVDILEYNYADHLIYTHFTQKLNRQLQEEFTKKELENELEQLYRLQSQYQEKCVQQLASANSTFFLSRTSRYALFRPYGAHTLGYVLKPEALQDVNCRLMAMPELTLTHYLKAMAPKSSRRWL